MDISEETKRAIDSFVYDLYKNRSVVVTKSNGTYNVKVNSETINHKNFDKFMAELLRDDTFSSHRNIPYIIKPSVILWETLRMAIKFYATQATRDAFMSADGFNSFDYSQLRPFVSVDKDGQVTFVHAQTKEIYPLSFKNYEKFLPKGMQQSPLFGIISFDPYNPEKLGFTEYRGQTVNKVNTYNRPEWQLGNALSDKEKKDQAILPSIFEDFFKTLFPSDESREFALDWLHFAMTKRCETYLVLNGAKGIGKGIFTDKICRILLGEKNWKQAAPSALESNFNAMLVNSRMIVLDEMPINDAEKIAKLKKYINADQAIEFKGVDVGDTVVTYNSFIISSNNLSDIRIEWDDRRFSVMDISEKKLDEAWGKAKIDFLLSSLENMDLVRNLGYWLMYRKPKGNEFSVFKGNHFWKLCYTSLPEWSKCVVDEVTTGIYDTIDDDILKMKHKERGSRFPFPQNAKVEDFIKSYKHNGMGYLGNIAKTDNGGFTITVSDEFYKGRDKLGLQWHTISEDELL